MLAESFAKVIQMLAKGTKSVADKLYPAMGNNDSWMDVGSRVGTST